MEVNCNSYLICGLPNAYIGLKTARIFVSMQIIRFNVSRYDHLRFANGVPFYVDTSWLDYQLRRAELLSW